MIFDIGANIGNWALANINSCDKIIAIEASPITFNKLKSHCINNNIILLNYAVCNNNGNDIVFYHANCDLISTLNKSWLTSESSRFYNQPFTEITCKTIGIDNLINIYGEPELIKIDVEGGEYECISSLTKKVKMLCFEWAAETNDITVKCLDYLYNLGFENFFIQNCDNYTFRPKSTEYYNITRTKDILLKKIPKQDWGMIWCK
jgi:FkbM family methyltransferase